MGIKKSNELPGSLTLKDHSQTTIELTQLEVHEARETLGLWITMDGNQTSQIAAIQKKIDKCLGRQDKNQTTHQDRSLDLATRRRLKSHTLPTHSNRTIKSGMQDTGQKFTTSSTPGPRLSKNILSQNRPSTNNGTRTRDTVTMKRPRDRPHHCTAKTRRQPGH
jgi:hypothetical protein